MYFTVTIQPDDPQKINELWRFYGFLDSWCVQAANAADGFELAWQIFADKYPGENQNLYWVSLEYLG